ncbi:MAG: hypothetical protein ACR65W_03905 [Methylocystis sp.]|uniref:hypothetical protein n=1 Tax=Methylocystis sp. TaxID=1911079 RepID=UPI003DA68895
MSKPRQTREEYLARSLSRCRPWEEEGVSRRSWYRRRGTSAADPQHAAGTSPSQTDAADADDGTSARLDEARAGVEALYKEMEAERERRANWWKAPLDDQPDSLVMRNIVRDETVTIGLDGDRRRERKRPSPTPRMWYDDSPLGF